MKSTLADETLALLECVEATVYLSHILLDLAQLANIKIKSFVDNKSLVDTLYSSKGIDDRGLRIDMAVLQDMLEKDEFDEMSWIDTSQQLANSLTKGSASTMQLRAAISKD